MNKILKDESDKKITELNQNIKNIQNDYTKLKDKYAQLKYQYFGEQKSQSTKLVEYENQIKYLQNQLAVMESVHSQKINEIQQSYSSLDVLKTQYPDLYIQSQTLVTQNEEIKSQLQVKDQTINTLNQNIDNWKNKYNSTIEELSKKIREQDDVIEKYKNDINQKENQIQSNKNKVNELSQATEMVYYILIYYIYY